MNTHAWFVVSHVSGVRWMPPHGTDVPDYKQLPETNAP